MQLITRIVASTLAATALGLAAPVFAAQPRTQVVSGTVVFVQQVPAGGHIAIPAGLERQVAASLAGLDSALRGAAGSHDVVAIKAQRGKTSTYAAVVNPAGGPYHIGQCVRLRIEGGLASVLPAAWR